MICESESGFFCTRVHRSKRLGSTASLVSAEADPDNRWMRGAKLGGFAKDLLGFVEREVAYGIEDPVESEAELVFGAKASALEPSEDGIEALRIGIAPVIDDTDGDVDLGVYDALFSEMLGHAPCGELIVFGSDESLRDGFEGEQEAGEVGEVIEGFGVRQSDGSGIVTLAEFNERSGRDGAFEMEMEFRLGEAANKGADVGHTLSLVGEVYLYPRCPKARHLGHPLFNYCDRRSLHRRFGNGEAEAREGSEGF